MGGFDRRGYMAMTRDPEPESRFSSLGADLARPLLAAAVVGVLIYGGYKLVTSTNAAVDASARNAQLVQVGQRLDDLERRLDQFEKERKPPKESFKAGSPSTSAPAPKPAAPEHHLSFSRPISTPSTPSSPDVSTPQAPPVTDSAQQDELNALRADTVSGEQKWEATADRLGSVVGELDSQRDAIVRDQARLDELAARFERNSQPFRLDKTSDQQQVGPVWLRLQSTDPRNQRYTMRLAIDDTVVELKDRALHEAVQFYASGGRLTFELVVSQIGKDVVSGRLVLPQNTATR